MNREAEGQYGAPEAHGDHPRTHPRTLLKLSEENSGGVTGASGQREIGLGLECEYNAENQLVKVYNGHYVVTFTYDYIGRRVRQTVQSRFSPYAIVHPYAICTLMRSCRICASPIIGGT